MSICVDPCRIRDSTVDERRTGYGANPLPPKKLRNALVVGAVVTLGAGAAVVASNAFADLPGAATSPLTASDGTNSIQVAGKPAITTGFTVVDAAWAPDGSQALFFDPNDPAGPSLGTLRHNAPNSGFYFQPPTPGREYASPTWRGNGSAIAWAARQDGGPWEVDLGIGGYSESYLPLLPDTGFHYLNPNGAADGSVYFEKRADVGGQPTGAAEIWKYVPSDSPTPDISLVLANGSQPAISPNGAELAFVRDDAVWTANADGSSPAALTNSGTWAQPTWSPDSTTIAAESASTGAVSTIPAAGGSPTSAGISGVPAYQTLPKTADRLVRLSGANRFGTAAAVSAAHWATAGDAGDNRAPADAVVLARSDQFPDALGGAALAAAKSGPLLMTPPTALATATSAEIQRVLGTDTSKSVYLLGGTGALSQAVQDAVNALGYHVTRLAGANRYETSIAIANAINPAPDLVLAATGLNFPDALAAGAAAGSFDVPGSPYSAVVLLTADTALAPVTNAYLAARPDSLVLGIGGQAAAATEPYNSVPVFGLTRFDTAAQVAYAFFGPQPYVGVATAYNWPDALAGGALMAVLNGPLLLVNGAEAALHPATFEVVAQYSGAESTALVFGGTGVIVPATANSVGAAISGPAGFNISDNPHDVGVQSAKALAARAEPATPSLRSPQEVAAVARHLTAERTK